MRNREIWKAELLDEIRTISNPEELVRLWSGKDSARISSFSEEIAHLFDDFEIDNFISQGAAAWNLSSRTLSALRHFRDLISDFAEDPESRAFGAQGVYENPKWRQVMDAARRFIEMVDSDNDNT